MDLITRRESTLTELIARLCPHGVKRFALGKVAEVRSGWGFPMDSQGQKFGDVPFYKVSDMNLRGNALVMTNANNFVARHTLQELGVNPAPPGTVIFPKIGAAVATNKKRLLSVDSAYDNNVMGLIPGPSVESRFLYYSMTTIDLVGISHDSGAVPSIRKSEMEQVEIPIPPLEIQRVIVQVLDNFMELEAELEAELQAELEARRVQYAHYRDSLLGFVGRTALRWATLGEIGEFIRGRRFTKDDVVPNGISSIHYGEIYTHYGTSTSSTLSQVRPELAPRLRFARPGDVIIAAVGETVEDVCKAVAWLGDGEVAVHDDCFIYRHSMNPAFVSYWFQTAAFHAQKNQYVARAKVKRISGESLGKIAVPMPSVEEQERIVSILDKFEALVNDISAVLPAEISARRSQYEYHRDRLLSFPEYVPA